MNTALPENRETSLFRAVWNNHSNEGATPVLIASEFGFSEILWLLITSNASVFTPMDDGSTPILLASQNGHVQVVKMLLGTEEGKQTLTGATPLFQAVCNVVKAILSHNKKVVNQPDKDVDSPLRIASGKGYEDIMKIVIHHNATVGMTDFLGCVILTKCVPICTASF